jgi:hypothetical protein
MVKKFIYRLEDKPDPDPQPDDDVSRTHDTVCKNNMLHGLLKQYKDYITMFYRNKKWDKFKKFGNDYELVFTSCSGYPSISLYKPISRSFFKLWEVLTDYATTLSIERSTPMKCLFLAEGPGGFVEAFERYRRVNHKVKDVLYGVTLQSHDRNIPQWKVSLGENQLNILYGDDGTGNLCNTTNLESIIRHLGPQSMDFVTADGGFDFSSDYNNQEEQSFPLILAEAYCAIRVQRPGGSFILKIYDMFQNNTVALLHMLSKIYCEVHIIKPLSSRPANSEKYVLCIGHRLLGHNEMHNILNTMLACVQDPMLSLHHTVPSRFWENILNYNVWYIMRQVICISKTIAYISYFEKSSEAMNNNINFQLEKAVRWCHKYNIPVCLHTLKHYVSMLSA